MSQRLIATGKRSGLLTRIAARKGFIVRANEKLSAFFKLEREALTVTFYLESIRPDDRVYEKPN